ncbi:MAG: hypothetical protein ACLPY1_21710 [Terracidiphilus sp.]
MLACAHCLSQIHEACRFCPVCGQPTGSAAQTATASRLPDAVLPPLDPRAALHQRGFGQIFGLDPRIAFLTVVVDAMLFGGDVATLGAGALLSVPAGVVLGVITYRAQRHWYGDDRESAFIKGLVVGLLTAIPTSLPGLLTIPSGLIGLAHMLRRKKPDNSLVIDRTV